ncbi:Permease of the drug/metabolite transporter (DMT) superfamily [Amycolatopsis pretoriensis]|uniref:Permease of the drug/metabolite transporter (DMT) superfamily n=1 Tax=Amycolatopsis pretoriensis TaxID=218821 RepID=A0A1H5R803_9PSEU|nr:DMT family transporter [Amycolatopsis pretoriensis]SEF34214.1 Permease of the drug/metabolite transporter (DMT) superfamily [Amycolatopsis pretoriensis]
MITETRGLSVAAVLAAALIWSSSFAVTKVVLAEVPPMTLGALRFVLAAAVLGVAARRFPRPPLRDRLSMGFAGLLGITAYFALENAGVDLATASDATLIVAAYPIITLVLSGRAAFSPVRLAGMLLALAGVWLVVREQSGGHRLWGDLLLVAGGFAWAAYNLVVRRDRSGASPIVVTYYQTLAGAGGFVLLSLTETPRWSVPSGGTLVRIGFLAVFCSVAAFLLYNHGLRGLEPSVAVNLLNVVPVAGLGWAVLLAGESLTGSQLFGGAVVLAGVFLGSVRRRTL